MKLDKYTLTAIGLAICLAEMSGRAGIELTTLASFNGTNGANPLMLIQSADGSLCGTAAAGGIGFNGSSGGNGIIFKLTMDGTVSNLVNFEGGHGYPAFMLRAADQNYYGTLLSGPGGGSGALFKLNSDGSFTNFNPVSFIRTNGEYPVWLVQDPTGNLYGVAQFGGSNSLNGLGFGTVFKIDTNSVFSTVARFNGTNGAYPVSLILGSDGSFYGVTQQGGTEDQGTVFRMTPDGDLSALFSFQGTNGAILQWLVQGSDGHLYGIATAGGLGYGSIFKVTTSGAFRWSFPFNGMNGSSPAVLMESADGNFYGTTTWGGPNFGGSWFSGQGTVFKITPEGDFTSLVAFEGTNGDQPFFMLTGSDGYLYGTTGAGGELGLGTVFRLSIPMAPVFQKTIRTNGSLVLTWSAVAGKTYQLQYNTNSASTNWNNLGSLIVATNGVMSASDFIGPDPQRFYRVALLP